MLSRGRGRGRVRALAAGPQRSRDSSDNSLTGLMPDSSPRRSSGESNSSTGALLGVSILAPRRASQTSTVDRDTTNSNDTTPPSSGESPTSTSNLSSRRSSDIETVLERKKRPLQAFSSAASTATTISVNDPTPLFFTDSLFPRLSTIETVDGAYEDEVSESNIKEQKALPLLPLPSLPSLPSLPTLTSLPSLPSVPSHSRAQSLISKPSLAPIPIAPLRTDSLNSTPFPLVPISPTVITPVPVTPIDASPSSSPSPPPFFRVQTHRMSQFSSKALLLFREQNAQVPVFTPEDVEAQQQMRAEFDSAVLTCVEACEVTHAVRWWSKIMLYLALLSVALIVMAREIEWVNLVPQATAGTSFWVPSAHAPIDSQGAWWTVWVLRAMTTAVSILLCVAAFGYHRATFAFDALRRPRLRKILNTTPWFYLPPTHLYYFVLECIVLIIHDPPSFSAFSGIKSSADPASLWWAIDVALPAIQRTGKDVTDFISLVFTPVAVPNVFILFMFLRAYVVPRYLLSQYHRIDSMTLGLWDGHDVTFSLLIRSIIETHPFQVVGILASVTWSILWYSLVICERSVGSVHSSYLGSVWLVFVTTLTIGYGDIMPATACGRVIMILTAATGIVTVSGFVNAINIITTLAPFEQRMVEFIDINRLKQQRMDAAARIITLAIRLYNWRRRRWSDALRPIMQARMAFDHLRLYHYLNTTHSLNITIRAFGSRLSFESSYRMALEQCKGSTVALDFLFVDDGSRLREITKDKVPGITFLLKTISALRPHAAPSSLIDATERARAAKKEAAAKKQLKGNGGMALNLSPTAITSPQRVVGATASGAVLMSSILTGVSARSLAAVAAVRKRMHLEVEDEDSDQTRLRIVADALERAEGLDHVEDLVKEPKDLSKPSVARAKSIGFLKPPTPKNAATSPSLRQSGSPSIPHEQTRRASNASTHSATSTLATVTFAAQPETEPVVAEVSSTAAPVPDVASPPTLARRASSVQRSSSIKNGSGTVVSPPTLARKSTHMAPVAEDMMALQNVRSLRKTLLRSVGQDVSSSEDSEDEKPEPIRSPKPAMRRVVTIRTDSTVGSPARTLAPSLSTLLTTDPVIPRLMLPPVGAEPPGMVPSPNAPTTARGPERRRVSISFQVTPNESLHVSRSLLGFESDELGTPRRRESLAQFTPTRRASINARLVDTPGLIVELQRIAELALRHASGDSSIPLPPIPSMSGSSSSLNVRRPTLTPRLGISPGDDGSRRTSVVSSGGSRRNSVMNTPSNVHRDSVQGKARRGSALALNFHSLRARHRAKQFVDEWARQSTLACIEKHMGVFETKKLRSLLAEQSAKLRAEVVAARFERAQRQKRLAENRLARESNMQRRHHTWGLQKYDSGSAEDDVGPADSALDKDSTPRRDAPRTSVMVRSSDAKAYVAALHLNRRTPTASSSPSPSTPLASSPSITYTPVRSDAPNMSLRSLALAKLQLQKRQHWASMGASSTKALNLASVDHGTIKRQPTKMFGLSRRDEISELAGPSAAAKQLMKMDESNWDEEHHFVMQERRRHVIHTRFMNSAAARAVASARVAAARAEHARLMDADSASESESESASSESSESSSGSDDEPIKQPGSATVLEMTTLPAFAGKQPVAKKASGPITFKAALSFDAPSPQAVSNDPWAMVVPAKVPDVEGSSAEIAAVHKQFELLLAALVDGTTAIARDLTSAVERVSMLEYEASAMLQQPPRPASTVQSRATPSPAPSDGSPAAAAAAAASTAAGARVPAPPSRPRPALPAVRGRKK